jgi:SAM-dependent methyltransferase
MESVICNFCGSSRAERVFLLEDYAFDSHGYFDLVRCLECGLLYLRERPTASEIASFYPAEYVPYKAAIEDEGWWLMRWMRRRNIGKYRRVVEDYSTRFPGRVLDVGCSTGVFLAEMRRAGWDAYGVELNAAAAEYARRRFALDVLVGSLDSTELLCGDLTAVTFWDVLEHTADPQGTLSRVHALLEKDGVVVITVPNYDSWDRHVFGRYWIGYDAPRHFYVFPRSVLERMLVRAGFEVLDMRCAFGGYYTTVASLRLWLMRNARPSLRRFFLRLIDFPGMRLPFYPLERATDVLGVGGKLLVVARKA